MLLDKLVLTTSKKDFFDEVKEEFVTVPSMTIELEHSLASLSKWEGEWKKPFMVDAEKTNEETLSYVEIMLLTPGVPPEVIQNLSADEMKQINDYLGDSKTATWFAPNPNAPKSHEIITAEVIYHWMVSFSIPFECQHWHLNRLLTLIKVCNEKNNTKKKSSGKSAADIAAERRALNEKRRRELGTSG